MERLLYLQAILHDIFYSSSQKHLKTIAFAKLFGGGGEGGKGRQTECIMGDLK